MSAPTAAAIVICVKLFEPIFIVASSQDLLVCSSLEHAELRQFLGPTGLRRCWHRAVPHRETASLQLGAVVTHDSQLPERRAGRSHSEHMSVWLEQVGEQIVTIPVVDGVVLRLID